MAVETPNGAGSGFDLVIRGGTVVDGTGSPPRTADVGIRGDRVVATGRLEGLGAAEVIDAAGCIVTPGFVDIHTHLDAQLAWDPAASSSCWHGVTSVVLGNCGVTFAPCRPEDRGFLAEMMESVEDIPAASILDGLPWDWETYGEYLSSIDRWPKGVNVGGMVGHCAVRVHAMADRSLDEEPASADDVALMQSLVDEAIASGALGFSTSRTLLHRVPDGRPVPGTWAAPDELLAFGDAMGRLRRGVFEAAPRLGERDDDAYTASRAEIAWMAELSRTSGRPVTFGLAHSYRRPDLYRRVLDFVHEANAAGAMIRPQTTARGIGILFGLGHHTPFDGAPAWKALRGLSVDEKLQALADPARRRELIDQSVDRPTADQLRGFYVVGPGVPSYDHDPEGSIVALAERRGVSPVEAFIELSLESDGRALLNMPFLNQDLGAVDEMLADPTVVMGLADAGAHVGQIMDASQPTFFLSTWVRERGVLSIEEAVRRLTSDTADLFGIADRGVLREGAFADVNVIDLDGLSLRLPEYVHDFPGGAGRYIQRADGYRATIVNGVTTLRDDELVGATPGVTLRSS
jgi:N-acyl-D-aspartate/D-glutamate deacylase